MVVGLTVIVSMTAYGTFMYSTLKGELIDGNKDHIASLTDASKGVLATIAGAESEVLKKEALQDVAKKTLLGSKSTDGARDYSTSDFVWKDDGYLYAYSPDGVAVMHPFLEGKNVRDMSAENKEVIDGLFKTAKDNPNGGFYEYEFPDKDGNIQKKLSYVYYFEEWDWVVGMAVFESELYEGVGTLGLIIVVVTAGLMLVINLIIWLGVRKRLVTVNELVADLEKMSDGDLNFKVTKFEDTTEVGRLALAVQHLQLSLKEMLEGVAGASKKVAVSSNILNTASLDASSMAKGMSDKVFSIDTTLDNQNMQLNAISDSIKDISSVMTYISDKVSNFSDGVLDSTSHAVGGKDTLSKASKGMSEIDNSVSSMESALRVLNEKSNNIHQVVEMIDNVSEQTKMLALNAQIEAARAGEQGRGFAVVATEVGKLAVETRNQVEEIRTLVRQIVVSMEEVATHMDKTKVSVKHGNDGMGLAEKAFNEIAVNFERMSSGLQEITADVEQVTSQTEEAESGLLSLVSDSDKIKDMSTQLKDGIVKLEENIASIDTSTGDLEVATSSLEGTVAVFSTKKK